MGDFRSRYDVVGCVTADRMKQQVQNKFPALRYTPAEVSHTTLGKRNLLSFDSRGKKLHIVRRNRCQQQQRY